MKKNLVAALAVGALTASGATAFAVCNQSAASQADVDLWNVHGCWWDFVVYQYQAYDLESEDWGDRGWNDACNVVYEFPKHWSASYLVGYGLLDDNNNSFHGTVDYEGTAQKYSNNFKDGIFHTATDDTSVFGRFRPHIFGANEIQTSCLLYNSTEANANPGSRAGDFMHEGWHGWQKKYGYSGGPNNGHMGSAGACSINSCDYFYFHGVSTYSFGDMWVHTSNGSLFHSPNQVQVEFLCDVADFPQSFIPASVRLTAAADANTRSVQRFINGPGYHCGDPRPW